MLTVGQTATGSPEPMALPPGGWLARLWHLSAGTPARLIVSIVSLAALARSYSFTYRYFISPPWFDYWRWVSDYQLWVAGRFGFYDLIKLHNEHRITTARLVWLLDSIAFNMNGRSTVIINLALLAGVGVLLWKIVRRDGVAGGAWDTPPLFWIALLSAVCQSGNLIFPFQVQFALASLFACSATWLLAEATQSAPAKSVHQAVGASVFVVLAVFSMGSGLFLAPALLILLALRRSQPRLWASFAPLCISGSVLFFYHYDAARIQRPPLLSMSWTLARVIYTADFIASSLGAFPGLTAAAGLCLILCFGAVIIHRLRPHKAGRAPISSGDAALVAVGAFVVMSALAGTLTARLFFGPKAALATRYATMSLLFDAALLGLYLRWLAEKRLPHWLPGAAQAAAAIIILYAINLPYYDHEVIGFGGAIRGEDQLLKNNVGIEGPTPVSYTGGISAVRGAVAFMHAYGLNMFAPENGPRAGLLARIERLGAAALPVCRGDVETSYGIDSGAILMSGWIADPNGRHTPGWIAALDSAGHVLGTARPLAPRPDVRAALAMNTDAFGFETGFRLPDDEPVGVQDAPIDVRVLGLFPGKPQPLCELLPPARIGPVLVEPAAELRDIAVMPVAGQPVAALPAAATAPGGGQAWRVPSRDSAGAAVAISFQSDGDTSRRAVALPFRMDDRSPSIGVTFVMHDGARFTAQIFSRWANGAWQAAVLSEKLVVRHHGVAKIDVAPQENAGLLAATPLLVTMNPTWAKLF
jgi:hypothetical protein